MCWRGYSLYDCSSEFRFFWMNSKLAETNALQPSSAHHRYRFSIVPVYECDIAGLQCAYSQPMPFTKDGVLFYNRWGAIALYCLTYIVLISSSTSSRTPVLIVFLWCLHFASLIAVLGINLRYIRLALFCECAYSDGFCLWADMLIMLWGTPHCALFGKTLTVVPIQLIQIAMATWWLTSRLFLCSENLLLLVDSLQVVYVDTDK
jgi:hypothetical protein